MTQPQVGERVGGAVGAGSLRTMDRPPPDPSKLLADWMEWERGETPPGKVIANLKTHGLRDLIETLVEAQTAAADAPA